MIFNLFGSKKKKEEPKPQFDPYAQQPQNQKPQYDPYAQPSNQTQKPQHDPYADQSMPSQGGSIQGSVTGNFRLEDVKRNAEASIPQERNRTLAYGAYRYGEVIADNFANEAIDYMVRPTDLDPTADPKALPIHFLFKRNGQPRLAVVIVTRNGYQTPRVVETRLWCERNGIKYIRMYADGTYGDWITGKGNDQYSASELQAFCKNWIVETISNALKY